MGGRGCVPSLLFDLGPNYGGGNEDNGDLVQKVPCTHCYTQCPQPCNRPPSTHPSTGDSGHSQASLGQSPVGSLLLSPGSWCTPGSVCSLQESVSPVLCKFWRFYGGINGDLLQKVPSMYCCTQYPQLCSRPPLTHASPGDSWTLTGKSGSVSCGITFLSPGSWCAQYFVCALKESVSPVLCKLWWLYGEVNGNLLECEVKWALGSITTHKASGGDRIPVELFQILNDDALKVLHLICQEI